MKHHFFSWQKILVLLKIFEGSLPDKKTWVNVKIKLEKWIKIHVSHKFIFPLYVSYSTFNPLQSNPVFFMKLSKMSFKNIVWKEKMLVTSIFSFSYNVF